MKGVMKTFFRGGGGMILKAKTSKQQQKTHSSKTASNVKLHQSNYAIFDSAKAQPVDVGLTQALCIKPIACSSSFSHLMIFLWRFFRRKKISAAPANVAIKMKPTRNNGPTMFQARRLSVNIFQCI